MPEPKPKAILFAGISGLGKHSLMRRFQSHLQVNLERYFPGSSHAEINDQFPIVEIPSAKFKWNSYSLPNTLYTEIDNFLRETVVQLEAIKRKNPTCILLHSHLSYFRHGQYLSWLNAAKDSDVRKITEEILDISQIVVLTDNVFDIRARLGPKSAIRLNELMQWRDVELLVSDVLSRTISGGDIFKKSVLFSVRHSMDNLAGILFSSKKKIYLSFCISEVKRLMESPDAFKKTEGNMYLEQNTDFRRSISETFSIFDPSAIDEGLLIHKIKRNRGDTGVKDGQDVLPFGDIGLPQEVTIWPAEVWPTVSPEGTLAEPRGEAPIVLKFDEVHEIAASHVRGQKSVIAKQIQTRDFRLIDQSEALLAYRPSISEGRTRISGGTDVEIAYVAEGPLRARKPFLVIKDKEDADLTAGALNRDYDPDDVAEWGNLGDKSQRSQAFKNATEEIERKIRAHLYF